MGVRFGSILGDYGVSLVNSRRELIKFDRPYRPNIMTWPVGHLQAIAFGSPIMNIAADFKGKLTDLHEAFPPLSTRIIRARINPFPI